MANIHSLPVEILSLIFHTVCEDIKASSVSMWEDVKRPPPLLNILLVSSYWNQVAVATPSLWTFTAIYRENFETARERVRRNLERSKDCPLNVVVRVRHFTGSEDINAFDLLFEEVAQHSHRWRTLEFNHLTSRARNALEQAPLPRLVSLAIFGGLKGQTLKLNTPTLTMYTTNTWDSKLVSFEQPSPVFVQLRHAFSLGTAQTLLQHLRRSQHALKTLVVLFGAPPGTQFSLHLEDGTEFSAETLGLSLPSLTEYTVEFNALPWGWNALRIAHMPQLRRLDIYLKIFRYSDPNNTVPFMPQLLSLNIFAHYPNGFASSARPLVAATPNLEEVSLTQTHAATSQHEAEWLTPMLSPSQDSLVVVWPRLVTLRLQGMAIPRDQDLRTIPLGRPAFKQLFLDSTCLERCKAVGHNLNALPEYFEVVVTDPYRIDKSLALSR
ncbi:hypothetical protein FRC00_009742 [Tulasnella sp. 408]|nr:hypothetical protein FRC00_009742 [Tulasnella sp. 408]